MLNMTRLYEEILEEGQYYASNVILEYTHFDWDLYAPHSQMYDA